nr:MAG TPA: hypothetical protein [Caudoviricetes sp.]
MIRYIGEAPCHFRNRSTTGSRHSWSNRRDCPKGLLWLISSVDQACSLILFD